MKLPRSPSGQAEYRPRLRNAVTGAFSGSPNSMMRLAMFTAFRCASSQTAWF